MVVIAGGWCVEKRKRNLHIQRTPPTMEKTKRGKKKEVPSIELANFDWIV